VRKENRKMKKLLQLLLSSAIFAFSSIASGADHNCQLVSASEANAAFGASMSAGVPAKSNDGKPDCEYREPLPNETMLVVVVIDKNARSLFATLKSSLEENPGKIENVAGLGDEAVLQLFSNGGGTILVRRGDSAFGLLIGSHKQLPVRQGLLELAHKALPRL
jgi:hypothetical protein